MLKNTSKFEHVEQPVKKILKTKVYNFEITKLRFTAEF